MINVFLGADIGNGTIKIVLIGEDEKVKDYVYLNNLGIISTLKKGLKILGERNKNLIVKSCGVTGAGREFASHIIGSDIIKTEIISQLIGVMKLVPNVKTIMDLGKEDMKILLVENDVLTDFSMNFLCAGGCGTYLETIAQRFGIDINDYGKIALKSKKSVNISSKCAVFGISSALSALNSGADVEDILMGVSNALIRNYIGLLGKGKNLSPPYAFVGGISNNKSVVKSLEKELGNKVIVPKYNSVSAAYGVALLAKEENPKETKFKGFKIANHNFKTKIRTCNGCENNCELNEIYEDKKLIGILGSRCGKHS